jgi:hypothetical protein
MAALGLGPIMITFILLGFFFLVAILFGAVAYTASQRSRAGMKGVDPSIEGDNTQSRATRLEH